MVPICFKSITLYRAFELCDKSNAARRVDDSDMGGEIIGNMVKEC
jgi:hypothetical protein